MKMSEKEKLECVFKLLEHAASHGLRCPTNPDIAAYLREVGVPRAGAASVPSITNKLIEQSRIILILGVYGNNWRMGEQR